MNRNTNWNFTLWTTRHGKIRIENLPFLLFHLTPVAAFFVDFRWSLIGVAAFMYFLRMFAITGFYHRYFSHRGFTVRNRFVQFCMALLGTMCIQQGPLWWASHHRHHHKYSDQDEDMHSPIRQGFWQSHVLWIFTVQDHPHYKQKELKDFKDFPEIQWLDRWYMAGPVIAGIALFLIGGLPWLVWGLGISTVFLWHGTFTINSLSHVYGNQRYVTGDTSRNNWLLAFVTLGEGWHNNHHAYQGGAKAGFYPHEIDITYYLLKVMQLCGLITHMGRPPQRVLEQGRLNDENRRRAAKLLKKSVLRRLTVEEIGLLIAAADKFFDTRIVKKLNLDEIRALLSQIRTRIQAPFEDRVRMASQTA